VKPVGAHFKEKKEMGWIILSLGIGSDIKKKTKN
jgi:hypothetical protein